MRKRRFFLGITGASGVIYAYRLLQRLWEIGEEVYVTVSPVGLELLRREVGVDGTQVEKYTVALLDSGQMDSPLASGSFRLDATIIAPCTLSTASKISAGIQDNLITRAAAVALKERWPLVLLIRETPLPPPALRSLSYLADIGVTVMPASPAFYTNPSSIEDLVEFVVNRILAILGYEDYLAPYSPPVGTLPRSDERG